MFRCVACGRRLRRPSLSGLGPVCARRLAAAAPRSAVVVPQSAGGPVSQVPGQTALPLVDYQPSLWSL